MSRTIALSKIAALVAFLFFAISAQADEIEREPEPAAIAEPEPEPELEPEPEPEPEPAPVNEYARSGFYVGGNFAGAWYTQVKDDVKDGLTALGYAFSVEVESPLGLGATVGYRFLPRLAGEVHLQWFSKANVELDNNDGSTADAIKIETVAVTGNVKGYLFTGRVQPFVLAGAGLIHFDTTDKLGLGVKNSGDDFVARFGGGVDLYINEHFVAVVEGGYLLPTGSADGLDHVTWSVGLTYRF